MYLFKWGHIDRFSTFKQQMTTQFYCITFQIIIFIFLNLQSQMFSKANLVKLVQFTKRSRLSTYKCDTARYCKLIGTVGFHVTFTCLFTILTDSRQKCLYCSRQNRDYRTKCDVDYPKIVPRLREASLLIHIFICHIICNYRYVPLIPIKQNLEKFMPLLWNK